MSPRTKNILANTATVLVSLSLTYLAAGYVVFRLLLPHLSLNLRPYFPDLAEVLSQNTKAGHVPKDFIALVGDSYAEGHGDWLLSAQGNRAKPFNSANVLHDLTGRDVINLGRGGHGSAQAMVRSPTRILRSRNCYMFPEIAPPRQIFVYFYEGNDIEDNLALATRIAPDGDGGTLQISIARFLEEDYAAVSSWMRCYLYLGDTAWRMTRFLITNKDDWNFQFRPSHHNKVVVAGAQHSTATLQVSLVRPDQRGFEAGMTVYDLSLQWLRRNYASSSIAVVYLPSPAATYRHAGAAVETYGGLIPIQQIYAVSQTTCEAIRRATLRQDVQFIDTRPTLRAATATRLIHGPRDWNHFNEAGYRLLAAIVAGHLENPSNTACVDWDGAAPAATQ